MWYRISSIFVAIIVLTALAGCSTDSAYTPPGAQPSSACDPNYAHCNDESEAQVAQDINNALH